MDKIGSRVAAPMLVFGESGALTSKFLNEKSEVTPVWSDPRGANRDGLKRKLKAALQSSQERSRASLDSNIKGETAKSLPECKAVVR